MVVIVMKKSRILKKAEILILKKQNTQKSRNSDYGERTEQYSTAQHSIA
jgi:hypothetical protein